MACGHLGEGRALLRLGLVTDGLRLLDQAMLAVTTDELHPEWAGDLHRHMMDACDELGDLPRARRWTAATEHWLATMSSAVLFTGICRVHRAQLHRMAGDWDRWTSTTPRTSAGTSPGSTTTPSLRRMAT